MANASRRASPEATVRRVRARVEGTVQGVGFRPFAYRLATELRLGGVVFNDERGVVVEVEGEPGLVESFLTRLAAEPPPLARVERLRREEVSPNGATAFRIAASESGSEPSALVAPDTATCGDCLRELFDPGDRRHRYPFINCTNCGPRFTIVEGVPYDRALTTMARFPMCERCRAEYEDPADRRFHAEPNACPDCGPSVRLVEPDGQPAEDGGDPIRAAAAAIEERRVVAVKGLGGFHLACRADHEGAVAALRRRKHREDRPFALMAKDVAAARALVRLSPAGEALLAARERPIVLAERAPGAPVAASVAPGSPDLGVMLPYSPLHHLLAREAGAALVMTSGNVSDEPIAYRDEDALERLAGIADLFLLHDRPIHMRTDDSVVRAPASSAPAGERSGTDGRGGPALVIRRSRGYVPGSLDLPVPARAPILACGAELKSAFCVTKGHRAWVGHHIGDLKNLETLESFVEGVAHFERVFAVEPRVVAHDLHPDYLSSRYALDREGVEHVAVQHHHAHLAACLAEHGLEGPAVAAIFDGAGHGTDGAVWGGELLVGGLNGFERAGSLWPVRLPGGDRAVHQPWRMACAWLLEATGREPELPSPLRGRVEPATWSRVAAVAASGLGSPVTTSAGRLFDAVAALCGLRPEVRYEGQAAVELEWAATRAAPDAAAGAYPFPVAAGPETDGDDRAPAARLDAREAILRAAADAERGETASVVGARFHAGLAAGTASLALREAGRRGLHTVVLSGGVFQNRLLLEQVVGRLGDRGVRVLWPRRLPPNDGGIAYGQAAVAAGCTRAAAERASAGAGPADTSPGPPP